HTIRSPRCTVSCGGLICMFSSTTVCCAPCVAGSVAAPTEPPRDSSAPTSTSVPRVRMLRSTALGEVRLDLLGVVQVLNEGRSGLYQQRFELGILGTRYQCLVQGIEHRLVIGDLVIDVCLVERRSGELLQFGEILIATFLQGLAGGAGLRSHIQL